MLYGAAKTVETEGGESVRVYNAAWRSNGKVTLLMTTDPEFGQHWIATPRPVRRHVGPHGGTLALEHVLSCHEPHSRSLSLDASVSPDPCGHRADGS